MMSATLPLTNGKAAAKRRGFDVRCPLCGDADNNVAVAIHDVTLFHCSACGEDFTATDVRALFAKWLSLLAWLETCPEVK